MTTKTQAAQTGKAGEKREEPTAFDFTAEPERSAAMNDQDKELLRGINRAARTLQALIGHLAASAEGEDLKAFYQANANKAAEISEHMRHGMMHAAIAREDAFGKAE